MPVKGENSLFYDIGFDTSQLARGSADAIGILTSLAGKISKINPFAALLTGAATVFAGLSAEAFGFAKRYEAVMREVATISQEARQDFAGIKSEVFALSQETLDDPIKLAEAYYQIVSAGYDGAEGLRLLEVASKAAVAGVTETEIAADGITTVLNAFNLSANEAQSVADAMFKTVELGKTTFDQLSVSLSTVAPLASSLGVSYNEVLAAAASLTKQGVPTSVAMTQIRSALVGLNEELGDGWSNAYTFQEAVQEIYERADGGSTALQGMVGRIEAVTGILGLAGKNAETAAADLEELANSAGAAGRAFGIITDGNNAALEILGNRVRALTEALGEGLLSVANDMAQFFLDLTQRESFAVRQYRNEREELRLLTLELERGTTSQERRKDIIDELKTKYPAFLKDIQSNATFEGELETSLKKVNEQLLIRIRIQENSEEIAKKDKELREQSLEFQQKENQLALSINELLSKSVGLRERVDTSRSLNDQVDQIDKLQAGNANVVKFYRDQLRAIGKERLQTQRELNALLGQGEEAAQGYVAFDANAAKEGADQTAKELEKQAETYTNYLNRREREYEAYEAAITVFGKEGADERYELLLRGGSDYRDFLRGELQAVRTVEQEKVLAVRAAREGIEAETKKLEKVQGAGQTFDDINSVTAPVITADVKFNIDRVSVADLRKQLSKVNAAIEEALDDNTRDELLKLKANLQKRIDAKLDFADEELDVQRALTEGIIGFSLKELNARLQHAREVYKEKVRLYGEESEEALKALAKVRDAEDKLAGELSDIAGQFSQVFSSLANAFAAFGADELAEISNQLAGVANGVGTLAAGIASNNPLAIIQGVADIASAAISVEIVSDTAKFEKQIKELAKVVSDLDRAIERSIGGERISNRRELIDAQKDLEEARLNAAEAEAKARKEVKFLGLTVARKGEGSGTDPERIAEFEEAAKDARDEILKLEDEIRELYTGTTTAGIVDSIVDGFKEGKKSAEDFAGDFEELMRNAVFESLKLKYLEKAVDGFFKDFAESAESDGVLSASEISGLRQQFNDLIGKTEAELNALNDILESAGITPEIGDRQGLTGEIKTITEDTANVLAGTLNKIMIDTAEGVAAANQSMLYLSQITIILGNIQELNDTANTKLTNIEKALV